MIFCNALFCSFLAVAATLPSQRPQQEPSMPVRELTAFKDGHAYVVRDVPLDPAAEGKVVLDELPTPVLGTFWPFVTGGDAQLLAAKAGRDEVTVSRPALTLLELAQANVGKVVELELKDGDGDRVLGKLLAMPKQRAVGEVLLVASDSGVRAVPANRVRGIEVRGEVQDTIEVQERRARIVLDVAGGGAGARVGVVYVEKGFRWIPSYRVDLGADGKASVQLQATMVNDLADLTAATVNLVVGVPKFAFADMVDPIALQEQTAQVAQAQGFAQQQRFSNMLSNSLQTQVAGFQRGATDGGQPAGPEVGGGEATEDLFVFPVEGVTLKRGERLVVPVVKFELPYRDAYRLQVPMAPPMQYQQRLNDQRVIELARELAAPKVAHVLRLTNSSSGPLTTAPALVLKGGRILAQGHMKYTPRGGEADLEINAAIDVGVDVEEHEVGRENGVKLRDDRYAKIQLAGTVVLQNGKAEAVEIEVVRRVMGRIDEVDSDGESVQLDLLRAWADTPRPRWWGWWSWPWWWYQHNGFGECRWTVSLEPGARAELGAEWHYYWR